MANSSYTADFYTKIVLDGVRQALINSPTYVYAADGISQVSQPQTAAPTIANTLDVVRNVLYGKKIVAGNLRSMVKRNNWTANTVYDQYHQDNDDLAGANFFVLATNRAVYKCLSNNKGAPSTVEPTSLDVLNFQLSDGYVWRLMYRLTNQDLTEYSTQFLIPTRQYANVQNAAVSGSIDHITIDQGGTGYVSTNSGMINQVISPTVVKIEPSASNIADFYTNNSIAIINGPGAGQIATITNYFSNTSGRFVEVFPALDSVTINSEYDIAPSVAFQGDGEGARARTIVTSGVITGVEIYSTGQDYSFADLQVVSAYGTGAKLTPTIAPFGGHGGDVDSELYARNLLVSVTFNNSESGGIPIDVSFSKFGMIRNLKSFANNSINYSALTFDNTVRMEVLPINGSLNQGDLIDSAATNDRVQAKVQFAGPDSVIALYLNKDRFVQFDTLVNQNGITASVSAIEQPDVDLHSAQLLCFTEVNTFQRSATAAETINIILKV